MDKERLNRKLLRGSIILVMSIFIIILKDIKEGNVTIETLTLVLNESTQSIQQFLPVVAILIVLLNVDVLLNVESLNKERIKLLVMTTIGLCMIILAPILIDYLTKM